jgi:hypothetical protein
MDQRGVSVSRPTIFEAAGGSSTFDALTVRFYEKVRADPLLLAAFASFTAVPNITFPFKKIGFSMKRLTLRHAVSAG